MTFFKRLLLSFAISGSIFQCAQAQDKSIGNWESLLPFNTGIGIATDGVTLYTVYNQSFTTFAATRDYMPVPYSKAEGMSDIGMKCVGYDRLTNSVILAYANGNIDLFKNNTFYNLPYLKQKTVAGTKTVYQIYTENGFAYLATSLGVLVIDLTDQSVLSTYQFIDESSGKNEIIPVFSFTRSGNYYYAATQSGLYRVDKDNRQLQNYQVWNKVPLTDTFSTITNINNILFLANKTNVAALVNDTLRQLYKSATGIRCMDAGYYANLMIGEESAKGGKVKIMNMDFTITDSFDCVGPNQTVQLADSSIYVASTDKGMKRRVGKNETRNYMAPGPTNQSSFDIYAHNKNVYIAHGGYSSNFDRTKNTAGVSNLNQGVWKYYKEFDYQPFDFLEDFNLVTKNEKNGTLYIGSFFEGLFVIKADGSLKHYKNDVFSTSSAWGEYGRQLMGLTLDNNDNLWVATIFSNPQLYAMSPEGAWTSFSVPGVQYGGPIVIDDYGQVWFVGTSGGGVAVYNTNGTLADKSDDYSYHLTSGVGIGNLPSNVVNCLAKDKNNNIWIGTDNGIGIVSNCSAPFNQTAPCDADKPIVKYDKFAGYLFETNNVRTIAVDGANRKWVGTNEGVWLLSSDASQIIYNFTKENSPLPSNVIQKIAIDDVTGDVYIGTDQGLMSFRSTATEGGKTNVDVLAFPNPVKSDYTGTIAIRGLTANADVRITDIAGQLVYKTKALGGQAVWNGKDYTGNRPQTGVYLVYASNTDGSETYAGKIVFIK